MRESNSNLSPRRFQSNAPIEGIAFKDDATEVLGALRTAMRGVMSSLDSVVRPADLQRVLKLDRTLSRHLFRVVSHPNLLGAGLSVPSRTCIERFIKACKSKGVDRVKLASVLSAYERFEKLVEVHAGDRVTFQSMISVAGGEVDEEWMNVDLQHRRNIYRGVSHALGLQAKTRFQCIVLKDDPEKQQYDLVWISGLIDFQVLRDFPSVNVYGIEIRGTHQTNAGRRPLGDCDLAAGFLMSKFSSKSLGSFQTTERRENDGALYLSFLEWPKVGRTGAIDLVFAEHWSNFPYEPGPRTWKALVSRPSEVLISDMLILPGSLKGMTPHAGVSCPLTSMGRVVSSVPLPGDHFIERLGKGPEALATSEVPNYPEMVRAAVRSLGWDVDGAEAIRLKVDFPMYQSSIAIGWEDKQTE